MSTKTPAKKPESKSAKQALAEGAKAIRAAKAAKKTPPKKPAEKKPETSLDVIAPIEVCKDDISEIMARCVTPSKDGTSLKLNPDTTAGEYVRIFDNVTSLGEKVQFLIGDVINEGAKLKSFGGKYAGMMASTGRSIDTLRSYASVAKNTPPSLRNLHPALTYTHIKQVAKVPALEDKKEILEAAADSAKAGKPLTVKEIAAKADKKSPKKKKSSKPKPDKVKLELRDPTSDESALILQLEDSASRLSSEIGGASSLLEVKRAELKPLIEKLDAIARFNAQLA